MNEIYEKVLLVSYFPFIEKETTRDYEYEDLYLLKDSPSIIFDKILSKNYIPNKSDNIYIHPNSTLPRHKVKVFNEKYANKIVTKQSSSNIEFISLSGFHNYLDYYPIIKLDSMKVLEWIKKAFPELLNDTINNILINNEFIFIIYNYKLNPLINYARVTDFTYIHTITKNILEFNKLLATSNLYNQNELFKYIMEDSAIITEEIYKNLCNMFESSQREDHILAMSIMSNSNIIKSLPYIFRLLNKYGLNKIHVYPEKNHINFKTLLTIINQKRYFWGLTIEDEMEVLVQYNPNDRDSLALYAKLLKEKLNALTSNEYFTIKTLEATPLTQSFYK